MQDQPFYRDDDFYSALFAVVVDHFSDVLF